MPRAPQREHFPNGKSGEREKKKCQKKYVKSRNICDTTPKRLPVPQFAQTDFNMFLCPLSAIIHNLTHILHTYTSHLLWNYTKKEEEGDKEMWKGANQYMLFPERGTSREGLATINVEFFPKRLLQKASTHTAPSFREIAQSTIIFKSGKKGGRKSVLISTCCFRNAAPAGQVWLQSTLNFFRSDFCKNHRRTLHPHFVR